MMETVEVTDHRNGGQDLLTNVPVQIVSTEGGRVEVISKMTPVTVNAIMPNQDIMTAQYINLHRMPAEHLNKVIVTDPISGELIAHHVDLSGSDFGHHTVTAQYYDTEELLAHGLTEDERRLAAELVAAQLKQHQGATILTTQDLLNAKTLTSLGTVSIDKSNLSAAIVTGYIQTLDDVQQQQIMQQQDNQERCIMKIYPTQPGQQELQVLNRTSTQPLPPLKKVLSSQSMMVRNKFSESPGIMVELQNSELLDTSQVPGNCIKPEHLDDSTHVVMTSASSTSTTTTLPPPPAPPPPPPPPPPAHPADDLDSEDYDAENETARAASRKSLPHKKRFPRKPKAPPAARSSAQKTYKCNKCGESFSTQPLFAAHKLVHATPNAKRPASFNCELCQKQFGTQLKFFEHLKQHYEPPPGGSGGDVQSQNEQDVDMVVEQSGGAGMENRVQQMGGHVVSNVQEAMGAVKGDAVAEQQNAVKVEAAVTSTGLTCTHCGKVFKRQKALETHMSVAHPSQEEIEEFSEPEDMMEGIRHVVNIPTVDSGDEEHMEEKMSRWRYQLNAASNYSSIQDMGAMELQDIQTLEAAQPLPPAPTPGEGAEGANVAPKGAKVAGGGGGGAEEGEEGEKRSPLMCLECNRVFNHRNSLLYHLRSHSGLRPHQCEVCGKGFISGSALKVHMRLHSGDKPYKCEHCSRHFRQWGDLKYHVTSLHSDQKQFQCEYCGKDFARKYSLNVHRRIHTGEKNYKCEFCGKTFRASSYLKNHTRIHTGEKPHCCDLCGKPFRVRSDMKRHRRTHTKDAFNILTHHPSPEEDEVVDEMEDQATRLHQAHHLVDSKEVELIEEHATRLHQAHHLVESKEVDMIEEHATRLHQAHHLVESKEVDMIEEHATRLHQETHQATHHLVEGEDESSETILPDNAPHTPLNLNIRQGDGDELVYTTTAGTRTAHSVDSRDGTLYVWIPAAPDSILSDE
ncbi:hypothetical protein LSTR_LSTR013819 [Laodelphax striatellus]|uniref:C2H2-type domain-containing protein n=1 Tax=Laodelphax striatellus TaxID=195883 RepID=A0A482XNQ7_LAOST|nr:hypothetical protein LSTR_LSTR013819 [Laodelphax striatellus]